MKHVHNLKYSELAKRVESLIVINEIIQSVTKYNEGIKHTADELIGAFTHVLIDIFERPMSDFPLRFAKYFVTIVNKATSCKDIMKEVHEKEIYDLSEQLLTRLLIENLDKVGENKEGEFILKNLNASMLRMLENCNHTFIFCVLFRLLKKYKDHKLQPKLPSLIIKCLLKLSKLLDKLVGRLDAKSVLLVIHEYLTSINHESKTQNDEMGIRIVKTMVNELVKCRGKQIWESYQVVEQHAVQDKHI
jgi:cytoskeleton-associated protein 5